jgi:hypothetical protein
MKTRLSMLVAVLCFPAYYSYTDGISPFNNLKKDRPSSNIFDPWVSCQRVDKDNSSH